MSKQGKISKVISWILIVLLLVAVCGSVAYFTNGFKSDFKTFFVVADGKPQLGNTDIVLTGEENKFDVKYTFGAFQKDAKGYSVKIVPSKDTDFDFTVDGEVYSFGAEDNLTDAFEIVYEEDCFNINGDFTMESVLSALYPDSEVAFNSDDVDLTENNFTLIVYSFDESAYVEVPFRNFIAVTGVELQETLIFEEQEDGTIQAK